MSQNPLVGSGAQSSKPHRLKPALAAALASLEVQLDQELARYRRTRTGYRTLSQPHIGRLIGNQLQELTAISTMGEKSQLSAEESFPHELENFGLATTSPGKAALEHEEIPTSATAINTPPRSIAETQPKVHSPAKAEEVLQREVIQSLTASVSSTIEELESSLSSDPAKTKTTPPSSSVSIVTVGVKEHKIPPNLAEVDKTTDDNRLPPEDYLESSEALLRSLTEDQPKEKKQTSSNNDSLLSPLGIGSMLLLLVASMTLGYVVFNPKSLPQISLEGWFKQTSPTNAKNTEEGAKQSTNVPSPTLAPIPKYPNLATDEFPEVRDSNDVVGLKPKPKPIPTVAPNPVPPSFPVSSPPTQAVRPLAPPTTALPPTALPPPTATTSPKPPSTKPKPNGEIKPSVDGFYHVITDNKGNNALASVRKIIPDAYLSDDGSLIYLGALKNKEKAQTLLQQLQSKGIKARIQQP
ncbi:hypothetical protein NUACC21_18910 [Scytonema sp. NUACC21]